MAFHLLELGVEEGDLLDVVVVTPAQRSSVTVDRHSVSNIKGMLDEDKNAGLKEFLCRGTEQPG
jgi:hypothetical protein